MHERVCIDVTTMFLCAIELKGKQAYVHYYSTTHMYVRIHYDCNISIHNFNQKQLNKIDVSATIL